MPQTIPSHEVHDALTAFANELGLSLDVQPIHRAPSVWTKRGLAEPPASWERLWLVALSAASNPKRALSVVYGFGTLADPARKPAMADVLWYLAADADAIEMAHGSVDRWAELRRFGRVDQATIEAFAAHGRLASELKALLSEDAYDELRRIYRPRHG